ncbi:LPS translocon maturation chaperone LptM [Sulfuritortus calidifontis]|nr:lipoprotein [Sulfuritortus calidifontis]
MSRVLLLCLLIALSGCGKKGPLYLPDDPKPQPTAPQ